MSLLIITRESIKIESVKSSVEKDIGYIRISSFIGVSTTNEFLSALEKTQNTKGLILDLRGNTGGLLANAVFIANMFLDGVPVYAMIDEDHLMADKMSPTDDMNIFYKLKENLVKLK